MKLSSVLRLASLFLAPLGALAQEEAATEDAGVAGPSVEALARFKNVPETDGIAYVLNNEDSILEFSFTNKEEYPVTIVGYTGYVTDFEDTQKVVANMSLIRIPPVEVSPSQSASYDQQFNMNLPPNKYYFNPLFLAQANGEIFPVTSNAVPLEADDKMISFLDPRFILLQLILLATLGGLAWFVYTVVGVDLVGKYLSPKPKAGKTAEKPKAKTAPAGPRVLDESWIPEHHKKAAAKKTKKVN